MLKLRKPDGTIAGVDSLRGPSRLLLALVGAAILALAWSAPASAQLPPICEEYSNLPVCLEDERDDDVPRGTVDLGDPREAGTAGTLPFTGYPITTLLLLVLILIASGLAIRSGVALKDRITGGRSGSGGSA